MPAPAWFFTCAILIVVLAMVAPGPDVLPRGLEIAGLALILAGVIVNGAALRAFAKHATPVDPEKTPSALVRTGPYRWSRNPMYVAGVIILVGLVLLVDEARAALVLPIYVWLVARRFVPADERRMLALFGDEWRAYAREVRRWI